MSPKLIAAITAITLALVFYTIGVFGERKEGSLTKKHLILFWLGLVCDTTGTSIMARIAAENPAAMSGSGLNMHAITGGLAIILMAFHAIWATYVMFKGNQETKSNFHKLSGLVWTFWLIPYICGVFIGTPNMPFTNMQGLMLSIIIAALIGLWLKKTDK